MPSLKFVVIALVFHCALFAVANAIVSSKASSHSSRGGGGGALTVAQNKKRSNTTVFTYLPKYPSGAADESGRTVFALVLGSVFALFVSFHVLSPPTAQN